MFADKSHLTTIIESAASRGANIRWVQPNSDVANYVGRVAELRRAKVRLLCATKRNVLLVGPSGVGKTAFVRRLSTLLAGSPARAIARLMILEASVGSLLAGTRYRGEFEKKVADLVSAVSPFENLILFFDEAHTMTSTGGEAGIRLTDLLKPHLLTGAMRVLLATTDHEARVFEADTAFMRRFEVIRLHALSAEERTAALLEHIAFLEKFHGENLDRLSGFVPSITGDSSGELHDLIDKVDFHIANLTVQRAENA